MSGRLLLPRRLDDLDRELIRRAPDGVAAHLRLMELFGLSYSAVTRIRNGTRGFPMQRGLACRPWELRSLKMVDRWYVRETGRVEARRKRALEAIAANEVVCLLDDASLPGQQAERLFEGVGKGRRHRNAEPKRPASEEWLYEKWPKQPASKGWLYDLVDDELG
jgi:hypothetical protein